MGKLYQFPVGKSNSNRCFLDKLSAALGELPAHVQEALEPLNRLPIEWHARAAQLAEKSARRHGVARLPARFSRTIEILVWLEDFGLHLRPTKGQVQRVSIQSETPAAEVAREVGRLAEQVGQELLIHALEGNQKITKLGRTNLSLADLLTREGLHNSHRIISRKSLDNANQRREAARCADFRNRADGIARWCAEEGFFGVKHYITAPACFHQGPRSGDIDDRWIAMGKPSPRAAADWLFSVLGTVRSRAAARGILPVGIRVVEAHNSGAPHINLPLWFKSKDDAKTFFRILRQSYDQAVSLLPEACQRGQRTDPQSIVYASIDSGQAEAHAAISYAYKHVQPSASSVLAAGDRDWCRLWSIRQFSVWGAPSAAAYKAFAHPSAQTRAETESGLLPAPLAALVEAAAAHDYATWLRMTHPLSRQRTVLAGPCTVLVINHSEWLIQPSKGSIFAPREVSLQLCETYPTRRDRPPLQPPRRPAPDPQNAYLRASRG